MDVLTYATGALGTNTYLGIDGTDALVIDPGGDSPAMWNVIHSRALTVRTVLLTHTHFDHIMGLPALLEATHAELIVPAADEAGLRDGIANLLDVWSMGTLPPLYADRTVVEGSTVTLGNITFTTWHTPGHTPGSCCYLAGDTLFSGDTVFAGGGYGRTDLPGGDELTMQRTLARLETALPRPVTVYPGHGPSFIWR